MCVSDDSFGDWVYVVCYQPPDSPELEWSSLTAEWVWAGDGSTYGSKALALTMLFSVRKRKQMKGIPSNQTYIKVREE